MGKTVVRYCDICKREIEADGFRIRIKKGKRFYSGLINGIESVDICDDCISVISDIVNHKINIDNLSCQTTSCLDCKMYDKEKHYCPRFCEVIRESVREVKEKQEANND